MSVATKRARERQTEKEEVAAADLKPGETREGLATARKRARLNMDHLNDIGGFSPAVVTTAGNAAPRGTGQSAYDHNTTRGSATPEARRAMLVGAGSLLRVKWPNERGRGVWWYGSVIHLLPKPNARALHVVRYLGGADGELYAHDLVAGGTRYEVLQRADPDVDEWCQQGQGRCTCGGDEDHEHPWYEPNSLTRCACHCEFCMYGPPVPASTPAGDYDDRDPRASVDSSTIGDAESGPSGGPPNEPVL